MNLFTIVIKNMRQRALATWLTAISVALGVALTVAILLIRHGMQQRFEQSTLGYEMVVGAKGSPLQLVLNTVFNLDLSPGNILWNVFEQLRDDKRVKFAAPMAVGDNYKGFRIVGTTDAYLKDFEFAEGKKFKLAEGRVFNFNEPALKEAFEEATARAKERIARERGETPLPLLPPKHKHAETAEAVIGANVAQETGLKIGQSFVAAHGVQESVGAERHEHNPWTVVGILAPTHTACDRAIYINLDSFYHIAGHEIRQNRQRQESDKDPDAGQISAIVLKLRSPLDALPLYREINDRSDAMAAFPAAEVRKLFDIVGNVDRVLLAQAILIIIVAGIAVAVSIYNSMSERRREIAILRALGARRQTIFAIVVLEAMTICTLGAMGGILVGHGIVGAANAMLVQASGFQVAAGKFQWMELAVLTGCILLGTLSGLGPAARAYHTEVAENLAPTS
jgi:putative ABC transport system permease protein